MDEVIVHFAPNDIEAEAAAGALRANRLHPRVATDPGSASLAMAGAVGGRRCVVYVPESEERAAREILRAPERRRR